MNAILLCFALIGPTPSPQSEPVPATPHLTIPAATPYHHDPAALASSATFPALAAQTRKLSESSAENVAPAFGTADSWRWTINAGYGDNLEGAEFGRIGAGLSWFIAEDVSLELELNTLAIDQAGDNAYGLNLNLLLRWHFLARDNWSLYIDGGAGLLGTTSDVPITGSSFNFTPQAGAGVSFEIAENIRMLTGIRWHHTSNANIFDENPGRDSLLLYAGVSFPF